MKRLSLMDLAFFVAESENSPKHVAGLVRCRKPKGAPADYAKRLVEDVKRKRQALTRAGSDVLGAVPHR